MKLEDRNQVIREAKKGVPNWMIAERLGVSENTLLRRLRYEMAEMERNKVLRIIEELKAGISV